MCDFWPRQITWEVKLSVDRIERDASDTRRLIKLSLTLNQFMNDTI